MLGGITKGALAANTSAPWTDVCAGSEVEDAEEIVNLDPERVRHVVDERDSVACVVFLEVIHDGHREGHELIHSSHDNFGILVRRIPGPKDNANRGDSLVTVEMQDDLAVELVTLQLRKEEINLAAIPRNAVDVNQASFGIHTAECLPYRTAHDVNRNECTGFAARLDGSGNPATLFDHLVKDLPEGEILDRVSRLEKALEDSGLSATGPSDGDKGRLTMPEFPPHPWDGELLTAIFLCDFQCEPPLFAELLWGISDAKTSKTLGTWFRVVW